MITRGFGDLLEIGMKQVQEDPDQADDIFETGMKQLTQADVTLAEFIEDVRAKLSAAGANYVPPYDARGTLEGQGTVALEVQAGRLAV